MMTQTTATAAQVIDHTDPDDVLKKALDLYGIMNQMDVAVEEMAELTQALIHYKRGKSANIAEEIADVYIMMEQIAMYFDIKNEVAEFRKIKIKRLALTMIGKEGVST